MTCTSYFANYHDLHLQVIWLTGTPYSVLCTMPDYEYVQFATRASYDINCPSAVPTKYSLYFPRVIRQIPDPSIYIVLRTAFCPCSRTTRLSYACFVFRDLTGFGHRIAYYFPYYARDATASAVDMPATTWALMNYDLPLAQGTQSCFTLATTCQSCGIQPRHEYEDSPRQPLRFQKSRDLYWVIDYAQVHTSKQLIEVTAPEYEWNETGVHRINPDS